MTNGDESDTGSQREMPRYRSNKEVWGLKIAAVIYEPDGCELHFEEREGVPPMRMSEYYAARHSPKAGGYWVRHQDGSQSWSPAEEFESDYARVN